MAGLLDMFNDPQQAGLLSAAAQMLQASGPSRTPTSFGQVLGGGLMAGMQGMQQAEENSFMRDYRKSQADALKTKSATTKAQQEALARVAAGYHADPTFKPSMGDLLAIDPDSALKMMVPGAVDYGLEPKIGINPATSKPGYFIQDKRGGTKWIDADVPENFKLVPGTDYKPDQKFNPRTGEVLPVSPMPQRAPMPSPAGGGMPAGLPGFGAPSAAPSMPEVDPLAPWSKLTSPKEQDEFKRRVYEADAKRLDDLKAQVSQGRSIMRDLDRFGELNRQQATGGMLDRQGWLPTTDPQKREMESIQARLAPNMRPAGSGTTSDRDLALYLQGLPGVDKEGPVNKNIRDQFAKQLADAEKQLAFREQYLVEKGHLNGVDEAFSQAAENGKSGGLDVSKLPPEVAGYLRQQNPDAFERGASRFQKNAGAPAAVNTSIPRGAVNMLKLNPKLRDQFDAKFGPGSAASVLGK